MNDMLAIVLNSELAAQYDRSKPLPKDQQQYLDRMDHNMDQGIMLGEQRFDAPDLGQRAQFVAYNLIQAIQNDDDNLIAASCSYLALRLPDLQQVKASVKDGKMLVDLVFDKPYVKETKVEFIKR